MSTRSGTDIDKVWGRQLECFLKIKKKTKNCHQVPSTTKLTIDKQEDEYINIIPNHDDDGWWKDVQTFDFGVQIDKENRVANRFAEVTEDEIRAMSKKKNAARTDDATKSGMKFS